MPGVIVEKASAKLNLALHVVGRREDGYHELDSIVAFADVCDVLSLSPSPETTFTVTGPYSSALPADGANIVAQAAAAMTELYTAHGVSLQPVAISLEKNLPVASGIGGGSADAAATIRALMNFAGSDLPRLEVLALALSLGADVPVCLGSKACRMQGIGEDIETLPRPPALAVVLVNPNCELATKAVFGKLGLRPGDQFGSTVDLTDPASWRNDLLLPARSLLPAIDEVLACFPLGLQSGMSGSGATCFALLEDFDLAAKLAASIAATHPEWWVKAGRLF